MDTTLLDSVIKQIISMSPSVLLAFVLMGLGWTLKTWPVFNDRYIPHGLIPVSYTHLTLPTNREV